jgi:lipoprotein-releasing system permease protein
MRPDKKARLKSGVFAQYWLFERLVAYRLLRDGAIQTTLISLGIALGVAVIVFMSALLIAVQDNLLQRVLSGQSHIQLQPARGQLRPLWLDTHSLVSQQWQPSSSPRQTVDQWQTLLSQLPQWPGIALVTPSTSGASLLRKGNMSRAINLIGVVPTQYFPAVAMTSKLRSGSTTLEHAHIIIGTELASELALIPGDKVRVYLSSERNQVLTVSGVVDLGSQPANSRSTFVNLTTAQRLLGLRGGVTELNIWLADPYEAQQIAAHLSQFDGIEAHSWMQNNAQFFVALGAQQSSNTLIRIVVACSVALGMASVLVVAVLQKSADIGMLRAMGVTRWQILRIFLLQGALLALAGAILGLVLAKLGILAWQQWQQNPDGSPLFLVKLSPSLVLSTLLFAIVLGSGAALIPAMRAARLEPVQALHGL